LIDSLKINIIQLKAPLFDDSVSEHFPSYRFN